MAQHKRKPAKVKPITGHPLFVAVVALWFGALFGLGSLAIRPGLIESVVMKSGIDLIIPAAAPPLGITARILLALTMASLGALTGALLARRLTRPKQEVRQRKRGASAYEDESQARRPIFAHDELGESLDSPDEERSILANRRRALAVEPDDRPYEPHDMAPLPGGTPQIFSVSDAEFEPVEEPAAPVAVETPLDLGAFPPPPPATVALDWAAASPITPPAGAAPMAAPFADPLAQAVPPTAPFAAPAAAPFATPTEAAFAPPSAEEAAPAAPAPSIFGMAATDGHVPTEFVKAAGFKTSVFETEPSEPLFGPRPAQAAPALAAEPAPAFSPEAAETEVAPPPAVELPSPASLGITDLAKRLQESMARRRAGRDAAPVTATAVAPIAPLAEAEAPPVTEPGTAEAPVEPEFAAPPVNPFTVPPFVVPEPEAVARFAEPAPFAELAPPDEPAPFSAPPSAVPTEVAAIIPAAPIVMPAALRPVTLDQVDDEDLDLGGLLGPRHLAMPSAPAPFAAPAVPQAYEPEPADEPAAEIASEDEASGTDEAAFGSLLAIGGAPRGGFVRIEEAEPEGQAIEPVVIFPGQAAANADTPFRRFDPPSAASQAAPVAAAAGAPAAVDAAEAEQALRAALANLQRMSGAA